MAKVTRKGKVVHVTLDTTDLYAQMMAKAGMSPTDLYNAGLTVGHEVIDVEYDQDHEGNYVRPCGRSMGVEGCYHVTSKAMAL